MSSKEKIKLVRVVTQAEVVLWHLKNFIERSNHDYDLHIIGNGVSRYQTDFEHVKFYDVKIERKISFFNDLIALIKISYLLIKIRPKIVHSIMPKSGFISSIAALITFVPIRIHTFTGQVWATRTGFSRTLLRFMDKVIYNFNTNCLTDSPSQTKFLFLNGFSKENKVIRHLGQGSLSGVSLGVFRPVSEIEKVDLRESLGLKSTDFVFTFLARKSVVKGIVELFESFHQISHLPNVKLLFIGPDESDGKLSELYMSYVHLKEKIISYDIVKDHQKFLAVSDVLCLPSSSEGFGTIVIEAAAMKIPTIGFDIVGLSDAIENMETGILVPLKDVGKFSFAMTNLYNDSVLYEHLRTNGYQRVIKYFSADYIFKSHYEYYTHLIKTT
ncbi:glycosyltransferase [Pedobacter aquatilis]|uniref:glycosyltransferase n=1 Tax=Pedobacter aquatilis TaxID=351343 RepID=UPI0025B39377|nr:glycosyltransferase [Pedobacter aquatilis]MDN3587279.1 glycosyltransferase [Pedobacter aquatilis]